MHAGRVSVNGSVVTELGIRVQPGVDTVAVDGTDVPWEVAERWVAFHKPAGVDTTRSDPHAKRTIYDVLPDELSTLRYVGRLDRDTEGLLLLTNAGDLANAMQHPSGEIEREYEVVVGGRVSRDTEGWLRKGVELEDGLARVRTVLILEQDDKHTRMRLVLTEGRKREVRRMMRAIDHSVRQLKRVRFGTIRLGRLAAGEWRDLTAEERKNLENLVARPAD